MKVIIFIFLAVCPLLLYGQIPNGEYVSLKTSYKNNTLNDNNFIEESRFNISIQFDEIASNSKIIIQDIRIPKKLLMYEIIKEIDYPMKNDSINSYKCFVSHINNKIVTTVTFHRNKRNQINLLISDNHSSQMFFNLLRQ